MKSLITLDARKFLSFYSSTPPWSQQNMEHIKITTNIPNATKSSQEYLLEKDMRKALKNLELIDIKSWMDGSVSENENGSSMCISLDNIHNNPYFNNKKTYQYAQLNLQEEFLIHQGLARRL
eukprot:6469100-Ditylum_brightwellii.AAC.1